MTKGRFPVIMICSASFHKDKTERTAGENDEMEERNCTVISRCINGGNDCVQYGKKQR
jgi:hypothetical protein